jgi:hypothetical protein
MLSNLLIPKSHTTNDDTAQFVMKLSKITLIRCKAFVVVVKHLFMLPSMLLAQSNGTFYVRFSFVR